MKALFILAAAIALLAAAEGCRKREPNPGPQAQVTLTGTAAHRGADGIAWFQGYQ
jgi:hypothetical protein